MNANKLMKITAGPYALRRKLLIKRSRLALQETKVRRLMKKMFIR